MRFNPPKGKFLPRRLPVQKIPHSAYGLNDREDPEEIDVIQMADCENITIDEGTWRSSPGWMSYNAVEMTGPYYAIYQFRKSDGTEVLLRMRQNILEYATGIVQNWTACTMPNTGSPAAPFEFTDGLYPTFATLNDIVLVSNGTDSVLSSTDGVTWTERATLPKAKVIMNSGKNRILFMAQNDSPSLISWCDINDPLTVGATSWQYIEPNDGQQILGGTLTPGGSLLVFKSNTIYELSDVSFGTVDVNVVAKGVNLSSQQSIGVTEDGVIFFAFDGVYEYIGGTVRKISDNITQKGRNFIVDSTGVCGTYFDNKYKLSIPDHNISNTYNAQEYTFHKDMPTNNPRNPYAVTRSRRYIGCYGKEDLNLAGDRYISSFFGDSRSASGSPASGGQDFGYINDYELTAAEGYSQGLNGEEQTCYFTTKFFTNEEAFYSKRFKQFYLRIKTDQSFDITLYYRFDPLASWITDTISVVTPSLAWELDDGSTGDWDDGFGWAVYGQLNEYVDLNPDIDRPRGIQFKVEFTTTSPVVIYDMGFRFLSKNKFK